MDTPLDMAVDPAVDSASLENATFEKTKDNKLQVTKDIGPQVVAYDYDILILQRDILQKQIDQINLLITQANNLGIN